MSMWPFSSKPKSMLALPPISDPSQTWGVAQGNYGGGPLIVRFSHRAKEWCSHPDLPIKLGFAVPLNSPSEGGLPDPAENERLDDIEDIIRREVASRTKGSPRFGPDDGYHEGICFLHRTRGGHQTAPPGNSGGCAHTRGSMHGRERTEMGLIQGVQPRLRTCGDWRRTKRWTRAAIWSWKMDALTGRDLVNAVVPSGRSLCGRRTPGRHW